MKTVRVFFSKTGRARFISHLDLNRTMIRALRRARVPLWYTEGFNRHPYVTFAAPLPLGCEGLRECMDIRVEDDADETAIAAMLAPVMPEGLTVIASAPAQMKAGKLTAARYRLSFDGAEGCSREELAAALAAETLPARKRTKKGDYKQLDVRPALGDPVLGTDAPVLCVTLPLGNDTVNPAVVTEAVRAFLGRDTLSCRAVRLELYGQDGVPFA